MSFNKIKVLLCLILSLSTLTFVQAEQLSNAAGNKKKSASVSTNGNFSAYLFVYFTGNRKEEEQIHFAISDNGYNFKALNQDKPVISSETISLSGGVRDPHILRCEDGKTFYMVATDMVCGKGWNSNRGMVLLKSTDLVNWTSTAIHIPTAFPNEFGDVLRVWAPQTIFDPTVGKYMVYFSMLKSGEGDYDKIYYSYANKDFTALETTPKQLFFNPTKTACIDGDIVKAFGQYHLFYKTEGAEKGIKKAVSDKLTGEWKTVDGLLQQTSSHVEGAGVFKLNNSNYWILMYDMYTSGRYQFTKGSDLEHFKVIDQDVTMDFHPRHGTVMPITREEAERLTNKWVSIPAIFESAKAKGLKKINIVVDTIAKKVCYPVSTTTDLSSFNPGLNNFAGVSIVPDKAVDFTKGGVKYTIKIAGKKPETYTVEAVKNHNPVLDGYYADPEILYSEKTGKFYIYPTSDGFTNWSGNYFKCFSSDNLVDWTDQGVILQLGKDVKWATRNAWAPCIIEKKINGQYKYFYYFTAAQQIGVAVSDNPTGPFIDLGKPLIEKRPEGITRGQVIDQDVFTDPKTGKSYLYWGNGFMTGAELNEDMTSIKQETLTILKPDNTFREGTYVFYRKGIYYFMWSEDDTRSENYRVRYATSTSPLGTFTISKDNLVIAKDTESAIFGTGHNSVLQIPGKDEWYIVYHRFNYPKGITQGDAAGYNREVCIDKMEFNVDGSIKQVIPTHKGIDPVKL
ncbi:MAG: family 43 glycosylhydrolase [Paludibacter sp.]|nr:family 43 glycosylhydrolase [Paludibacter sp.]